jgi:hypothetical protein
MTSLEHLTFNGLRGDHDRDWFRLSDLIDASQAAGYRMTRYECRLAIAHLPKPEKAYGHAHYGRDHLIAVIEFATAEASKRKDLEDADLGNR